ncbi:MAG: precorrin-3B C(17)-methyltransferase, partial [Mesorhizobium sp.]
IEVFLLAEADAEKADMATCIIIGSPETRIIKRGEKPALVYTPRSAAGPRK